LEAYGCALFGPLVSSAPVPALGARSRAKALGGNRSPLFIDFVAPVFAVLALTIALQAPACWRVALGPAVELPPGGVATPAVLELRPHGRVAAAADLDAALVGADRSIVSWGRPRPDSITAAWRGGWLGSSVEVRVARDSDAWRGRYVLRSHQVSDGRQLWRGAALAVPIPCDASSAQTAPLARWQGGARPDTAAAVAEALAEFHAFLRAIPVHALSLMNYRLAEYACRHGRLPVTLTALRTRPVGALAALDSAAFLDAWGHPLRYQPHAPGYELRSAGPDGRFGTPDDLVSAQDAPLRRERATGCV